MARREKVRWSYKAGEKGRNRVRAFEVASGMLHLEFMEAGQRCTAALGHRDKQRAKQAADQLAADFTRSRQVRDPDELTIGELFDNYVQDMTPGKSASKQAHDRRVVKLWLEVVPASRPAVSLVEADARRYIAYRKNRGDLRPGKAGRNRNAPIQPRSWRADIQFVGATLRWALAQGRITRVPGLLSFRDRTRSAVVRPSISDAEFDRMLSAAVEIGPACHCMMMVTHETGHRSGNDTETRILSAEV